MYMRTHLLAVVLLCFWHRQDLPDDIQALLNDHHEFLQIASVLRDVHMARCCKLSQGEGVGAWEVHIWQRVCVADAVNVLPWCF